MKTITVKYQIYKFKELNREAKDLAIANWYAKEDYPFFNEDLKESCRCLLDQYKIKYNDDLSLGYSLSYSQGDGLNFQGTFKWKNTDIKISHTWRYPFAEASYITMYDKNGDEIISKSARIEQIDDYNKFINKFIKIYLHICNELEKEGYEELAYRMDDKEFAEHCETNGYNFFKDGRMANL